MPKPRLQNPLKHWPPHLRFSFWYVIAALWLLSFWQLALEQMKVRPILYSEFKQHVHRGEVVECAIGPEEIRGYIRPRVAPAATRPSTQPAAQTPPGGQSRSGGKGQPAKPFFFRTVRMNDPKLIEELQAAGAKFTGVLPSKFMHFLWTWVLPIFIIVLLWSWLSQKVTGMGSQVMTFGKSKARIVADKSTGVTFDDVAGCDEAKAELVELVEFLRNPQKYTAMGARTPKGVLLVGPPGTGKTLLARAVAGEAAVPFFSLSGSDFVEMFVGVGAARVRDLFTQAKEKAPCIVFIDELDAIGRQRGVHMGAVNDEREQTLNQLLVEMDGFEANAGVIIIAATNRPEVLDRALLRPGRFDRQVVVDAPDLDGREAILRVHARGKPLADDVDLRRIAQATPGFSGADLANAINEAALLAVRRGHARVTMRDLEDAVEKVVAGPERKSRRLSEAEKTRVAYHETGHALVAAFSEHADPVHKITIVPRGRAALGYTLQLPTEEQFLMTQEELLDRLKGLLGGRAAEEVVFGSVSTGAQNDLERATALARQMVCLYGMSRKIGLAQCARRHAQFLDGEGLLQRDCSEQTNREIDEEVKRILDEAYAAARDILSQHRDRLERVAAELLRVETLDRETFERLVHDSDSTTKRQDDVSA